jgi:hypothetical protein
VSLTSPSMSIWLSFVDALVRKFRLDDAQDL